MYLSLLYLSLVIVVTLSFAATSYTATEGELLSVCISYSGGELDGATVTYTVTTLDGTATDAAVGERI